MVKRKPEAVDISKVITQLSRRLAGRRSSFYIGEEENVSYLLDIVTRTVEKGESNSLLVLGPHGVGKTALVRNVMREAAKNPAWAENAMVVELNGFLQTDDKLALKEITRQLNLENVVGDKVFGSFADHLSFLLASLKTGDKTSKPIIFILEEFDMFCSHKNQALLYNLFDTAQSRAVPICVIGVSCQIDVTELLEKRVNSRFSHRHLSMLPHENFKEYLQTMVAMLKLEQSADNETWNKSVADLFACKEVQLFVEDEVFSYDKTMSHMKSFLYRSVICMAERGGTEIDLDSLKSGRESCSNAPSSDPTELIIRDLSIVEICLLIAVKHICDIYDNEPFNFEMVFHEYVKFKRHRYSTLPEDRSVVFKCWENLLALELIIPKGDRGRNQQLEYMLNSFHMPHGVVKRAVDKYPSCPTEVLQWLNSSAHICRR